MLGRQPSFDAIEDLAYLGEGRIQVCHAGHGELVVPVVQRGRAVAVLFAGPFRCAQAPATVDGVRTAWRGRSPPELPASRVDDLLELLRQLAARLACWLEGQAGSEPPLVGPSPLHRAHVLAQRRFAILQFIREQATRPVDGADLARALGLSLSRTKHVVQEACGAGFNQLLLSARLEAAADLLRHTDLPILETALRSGFNDSSHFHRRFRTRFGATPAVFRRNATRREA